ncbi:LPKTxAVK-anchored surface protein [Streptococcus pluranimalium]|uniref:LPKTxAVK-anchored surface protein n=1 Tax=Streptococcus pluranimalium TaxID=82348 RepID=UPI0039FBB200
MKMSKQFTTISAVLLASSALALGTVASSVSTVSAQDYYSSAPEIAPGEPSNPLRNTLDDILNSDGSFKPGFTGEVFNNGTETRIKDAKTGRVLSDSVGGVFYDDNGNIDYARHAAEINRMAKAIALQKGASGTVANTDSTSTNADTTTPTSGEAATAPTGTVAGTGTSASPSGTGAAAAQAGKTNGRKDASSTAKPASKPVAAAATAKADKALPKTSAVK